MIDLTAPVERAFLIGLDDPEDRRWPVQRSLAELAALAETAGAMVVGSAFQRRTAPDPVWYFGKGRAAELVDEKAASDFNVLVVDDELEPNQQRSLEKLLECKVLDRSALIIDIFARHAKTKEGRLQVELAALEYHLPRLTRLWTHLSRTGGGIGTRGPGESQLETDRRLIREKIKKVRAELDNVKRHRATTARQRDRHEVAGVALVGYTNAGKSTLLNALADADLYAADMLFATLDPTMREVRLPGFDKAILSDTVGFVSDLPTQLVAAFQATLEEVASADILVHVRDIAHADRDAQRDDVEQVLSQLGLAPEEEGAPPRIEAWNKIDLLAPADRAAVEAEAARREDVVPISAVDGEGLDALRDRIAERLQSGARLHRISLPASDGSKIAWLHARGDVIDQETRESQVHLQVRLSLENWARFQSL